MACIPDCTLIPGGLFVLPSIGLDYVAFGHNREHVMLIHHELQAPGTTMLAVTSIGKDYTRYAALVWDNTRQVVSINLYTICKYNVELTASEPSPYLHKHLRGLYMGILNTEVCFDLKLEYLHKCITWQYVGDELVFTHIPDRATMYYGLHDNVITARRKLKYMEPWPLPSLSLLAQPNPVTIVVINKYRRVSAVPIEHDTELVVEAVPHGRKKKGQAVLGDGSYYDSLACGRRVDMGSTMFNLTAPVGWEEFVLVDVVSLAEHQRITRGSMFTVSMSADSMSPRAAAETPRKSRWRK